MAVICTMACGCRIETDAQSPPICETHQERRVQGVSSKPPRIVAVDCKAEGPLVVQHG